MCPVELFKVLILQTTRPWYYLTQSYLFSINVLWYRNLIKFRFVSYFRRNYFMLYTSISRHITGHTYKYSSWNKIKPECAQTSTFQNKCKGNTMNISTCKYKCSCMNYWIRKTFQSRIYKEKVPKEGGLEVEGSGCAGRARKYRASWA